MGSPWRATDNSDGEVYDLDALSTQKWLEGHIPGAERAATWLIEEAVELFKNGKDAEAALLRATSKKLLEKVKPDLERNAQKHEDDHPYNLGKSKKGSL